MVLLRKIEKYVRVFNLSQVVLQVVADRHIRELKFCLRVRDYDFDFSIPVCRLYVITSQTNLIPGATFSTAKPAKQHEEVRSLETSLV